MGFALFHNQQYSFWIIPMSTTWLSKLTTAGKAMNLYLPGSHRSSLTTRTDGLSDSGNKARQWSELGPIKKRSTEEMQKICPETFSGPAERWGEAGWLRTSCHLHINGFFCLNSHSNRKILRNENGQHLCLCFPPNVKKIVSARLRKYWYSLLWRTSSGIDNLHINHLFTWAYNVDVS